MYEISVPNTKRINKSSVDFVIDSNPSHIYIAFSMLSVLLALIFISWNCWLQPICQSEFFLFLFKVVNHIVAPLSLVNFGYFLSYALWYNLVIWYLNDPT